MARFYADEQFPKVVSEFLRTLGHDVLTIQEAGNANRVEIVVFLDSKTITQSRACKIKTSIRPRSVSSPLV